MIVNNNRYRNITKSVNYFLGLPHKMEWSYRMGGMWQAYIGPGQVFTIEDEDYLIKIQNILESNILWNFR